MNIVSKQKKIIKKILHSFFVFALVVFFFNFVFLVNAEEWECKDYKDRVLTQEEYQKVIDVCDAEIERDKNNLKKKKEETSGLRTEVNKLNTKIKISQAYINRKIAKANSLKKDIKTNTSDIKELESNLLKAKKNLGKLLYQKNIFETKTALEAILMSDSISDFYNDSVLIKIIGLKISEKINYIKKQKKDLERLSIELSERAMYQQQLAEERKIEQKNIARNQKYKKELLDVLKKEEGKIQSSILSKESARQKILQKTYFLKSGKAVTFGEAYNAIYPYKKVLGLDPAFVLAILFQESGHKGKIGGNIGRCTYNQPNKHGNKKRGYTVMSNTQKPAFLTIMKGLGVDPSSQKVSCPIPKDGAYGGALGPAQFMPTTWMGIRAQAGKIIGKKPEKMSPFVNGDAFIASGTFLKNLYYSKSCTNYANKYKHISSVRTLRERCAAAMYYAGGNWWKHRMGYGQSVVRRADRFRADIKVLNDR